MSKLLPDVQKLDQKIAVDTGSPNIEVPNEAVTYDSGWKSNKYMSGPAFNTKFNGGKEDFSAELREFSKVVSALKSVYCLQTTETPISTNLISERSY